MTSQTNHYIELSDILGLRFECKTCGTSVSFPLSQNFDLLKLNDCPSCGKPWVSFPMGASIKGEIEGVIKAIVRLSGALSPEGKFPTQLALKLEVSGCEPPMGVS